jgi:hypothetical protein
MRKGVQAMAHSSREVEVHLPLEKLIEAVCNLPTEDLTEIKRQIETRLQQGNTEASKSLDGADFWNTELGRTIRAEADPSISREAVLKATASIPGSMAAAVISERDER